jgi:hypothetical protein
MFLKFKYFLKDVQSEVYKRGAKKYNRTFCGLQILCSFILQMPYVIDFAVYNRTFCGLQILCSFILQMPYVIDFAVWKKFYST